MSVHISPRFMSELSASFALAAKIGLVMRHNPEVCWAELKRKRRVIKAYARALEETEFMPCGYQDAAGDRLDYACREFSNYLNAMNICKCKFRKSIIQRFVE